MKLSSLYRGIFVTTSVAFIALACHAQNSTPQSTNIWFAEGQATLQEKLLQTPNTNTARNVIIFVADGNGVGTNYATRLFHGQSLGNYGDEHVLPYEAFPHLALVKTYNTNAQTPDSSGTATAMFSGVKTKAGVVGVDESLARGDCEGAPAASVTSIAEMLANEGKAVGVISTARVTHATPASVYAHAADRNYEDDSALPAGCEVPDIAVQLIDSMKAGTVDLALGGGRRHFLPAEVTDNEGNNGKRNDGNNLIEAAKAAGIQYIWNDATFASLGDANQIQALGLFESSHMKYEYDRTDEPSIADMTKSAIEFLSRNDNGYFLQIESGRVDHANHASNLHRAVTDGVAFAEAVAMADAMTNEEDTLIIVTADHEHAIAFNGYCGRGTPITGVCYDIDTAGEKHHSYPVLADDGKPYTVVGYLNGVGSVLIEGSDGTYSGSRPELTQEQATDPDYTQQALIPRSSETHSGEDVAVYARGPWAHLFDGTVEQNYLFHVMHHAAIGSAQ